MTETKQTADDVDSTVSQPALNQVSSQELVRQVSLSDSGAPDVVETVVIDGPHITYSESRIDDHSDASIEEIGTEQQQVVTPRTVTSRKKNITFLSSHKKQPSSQKKH